MKSQRIKKIQKEIDAIQKPIPEDSLIQTYSNFLQFRESLPFYQFNSHVYDSLIFLATDKWNTNDRISRLSLLRTIKRYSIRDNKIGNKSYNSINSNLELSIRKRLFNLYKTIWENLEFLKTKQKEEVLQIINLLLINVSLQKEEEEWLCNNCSRSSSILNRVLRYPKKSSVITAWIKENFDENKYRSRRAELISFMLDGDSTFVITKQILLEDFNYQNKMDLEAIEEFKKGVYIFNLFQKSNQRIIPKEEIDNTVPYPELRLCKRFYSVPKKFSATLCQDLPDIEKLTENFHRNLEMSCQITMLWAIGYSRMSKQQKSKRIIEYFSKESEKTFMKVCKKFNLTEPLKWLLHN